MPFTFRLRRKILPGVTLNLSRSWPPSLTFRAGRISANTRTQTASVDLPGPVNYRTPRLPRHLDARACTCDVSQPYGSVADPACPLHGDGASGRSS